MTAPALLRTPPPRRALWTVICDELGWTPHDSQREILLPPVRNKVVSFGRRAGKSAAGGMRLVPELFRAIGEKDTLNARGLRREYWIVGPTYGDSEKEFRVIWEALRRLEVPLDRPGSYNNAESGAMRISALGGRFIVEAKSAQYPGTLVGEGLSGVVFSEAAKLKPSVWIKYVRPTLADFGGWTYFGSTPEGRNWFYDLWATGQDPDRTDWASWRAPSWVNPYVYPMGVDPAVLAAAKRARQYGRLKEWLEGLRAEGKVWTDPDRDLQPAPRGIDPEVWALFLDQTSEGFNQEIEALFTEFVGRVFKNFDEEMHVNDVGFRADWETYAAVDWGFTNPTVWLLIQIDPHHERVHIVDEYYETGRTTEEAAAEIASRGLAPRTVRSFFPDPAEPDRARTMSNLLQIPSSGGTGIPKVDRLTWIRKFLKPSGAGLDAEPGGALAEWVPALTVNRRCVNTIHELNIYKYPDTKAGSATPEEPEKKDDHVPEALGRFFSGMFGRPGRRGARQTKVRTTR